MTFFGHAEGPRVIAEFTANVDNVALSFTGIKAMQDSPISAGIATGPNGGWVEISNLILKMKLQFRLLFLLEKELSE